MQLERFAAVVEEGSVPDAALRVFRTQPAVSIAISKLEREFEAPLLDRSRGHEYCLTHLWEALYHYATRMLSLRRETISVMGDIRNLRMGRVRIGANESISLHLLPKLAQAFLTVHSGVRLAVKCDRSKSLLADLKDRKLDLALLSFRPEDKDLGSNFVMRDELVLITSPTHAFAGRRIVNFKDLSDQSLLVMDVSEPSPWHSRIAEAFLEIKPPLRLTVENAPIETIKKMVAIGLGVGFVPLMSVGEELARGELAVVEVAGFRLERSFWLVNRHAAHQPSAKAFMRIAASFGEQLRGRSPVIMACKPSSFSSELVRRAKTRARIAVAKDRA